MGLYFITKLNAGDPYPVMAFLMVTAVIVIIFNLIADLATVSSTRGCAMTEQTATRRPDALDDVSDPGGGAGRYGVAGSRAVPTTGVRGARPDAQLRVGPRGEGPKPVGVRAHALLPPPARRREPHRPDRARRCGDLRQLSSRRTRTTSSELEHILQGPTLSGWHLFGTDQLGRDYLSRVIFGLRTSLWVALFVAGSPPSSATIVGAIAGYYGGSIDNLLMRFVDLLLVVPFLVVLLVLSAYLGQGKPFRVGLILALLFWLGLARIVRGIFLSLREKEFVEAAKAAGAGDLRIMFRHMLPSTLGPIVVDDDALDRRGDPHRGGALVPRLRRPAADAGAREAHRRRAGRGLRAWWLVTFPGS